jgi:hypothetical protein
VIPQVVVKDVDVQVLEVGRQGELDLVGADDGLVRIREHIEAQLRLLGDGEAVIGALRADRNQGRSPGGDLGQCGLKGAQIGVAVRAPFTPVEDQHHRAARQTLA